MPYRICNGVATKGEWGKMSAVSFLAWKRTHSSLVQFFGSEIIKGIFLCNSGLKNVGFRLHALLTLALKFIENKDTLKMLFVQK